jgi:uncharacterized protein (DUF924 family)
MTRPEDVLDYWIGALDEDGQAAPDKRARWWRKDPALDAEIAQRFGAEIERAARGEIDAWAHTPRGRVALVVLLDQLSRNAFRGTARAFACDARALALAEEGTSRGEDDTLAFTERWFLYMPFMHAEDRAAQARSVALFERLADGAPPPLRESARSGLSFAQRHRDIVERFGRFPHRNAWLGRTTTPEEAEFLTQPGSSF